MDRQQLMVLERNRGHLWMLLRVHCTVNGNSECTVGDHGRKPLRVIFSGEAPLIAAEVDAQGLLSRSGANSHAAETARAYSGC